MYVFSSVVLLLVVPHLKLNSNDEIGKDCAKDGGEGLFLNIKKPHSTKPRSCIDQMD